MLWVVLVTTVVAIPRFSITPTTAVVCLRWVLFCGHHTTVLLIVLLLRPRWYPSLGQPLIIAINAMA
jgi:hypothetical protein